VSHYHRQDRQRAPHNEFKKKPRFLGLHFVEVDQTDSRQTWNNNLGGGHRQRKDQDADHDQWAAHLCRSKADEALAQVEDGVEVYCLRDGLIQGISWNC